MFVLEGQQLEKLFDLLEDNLSALPRDHYKLSANSSAKWKSQVCFINLIKAGVIALPFDLG